MLFKDNLQSQKLYFLLFNFLESLLCISVTNRKKQSMTRTSLSYKWFEL